MFRELEVVAVELLVVTRVSSSSTFGSVFAPVIAERGRKSKRGERSPLSLFAPISRLFPDVTAGDGRRSASSSYQLFIPEKELLPGGLQITCLCCWQPVGHLKKSSPNRFIRLTQHTVLY